jgi:AbrB family looped-hinge helix DNA binding protein
MLIPWLLMLEVAIKRMSHSTDLVKSYQVRKNGSVVVVIPKKVREDMGLETGTSFLVKIDGNKLVYRPVSNTKRV